MIVFYLTLLAVDLACLALILTRMYPREGLGKTILAFFFQPYAMWWAMRSAGDVIDPEAPQPRISNKLLAGAYFATTLAIIFADKFAALGA